jgi:hypothetical protein
MTSAAQMTWEYRAESGVAVDQLNALGRDGWELIAIDAGVFYFKRPGLSFREHVTHDQRERVFAARPVAGSAEGTA